MTSAYLISEAGGDPAWGEAPGEPIGPLDVRVAVKACGLCATDLDFINNAYGNSSYPMTPGHEVVGEVIELGSEADPSLQGRRVGVGLCCQACFSCETCREGSTSLCMSRKILLKDFRGGFGDEVIADSRLVFPIPDAIDDNSAAPLMCAGTTVYSSIARSAKAGHNMAVLGFGGLGHLALLFGKAMGLDVVVVTNSEGKVTDAKQMGADEVIVGGLKEGSGHSFNLILDTRTQGGGAAELLNFLKPNGNLTVLSVGHPLEIDAQRLVPRQLSVSGAFCASAEETKAMLEVAADKSIRPTCEVFGFDELPQAMEALTTRGARYRIVLSKDKS